MSQPTKDTWTCPSCREELTADFDQCWHCGTSRSGVTDPAFSPAVEPHPAHGCRSCGYLLEGLAERGVCPECGYPFEQMAFDTPREASDQPAAKPADPLASVARRTAAFAVDMTILGILLLSLELLTGWLIDRLAYERWGSEHRKALAVASMACVWLYYAVMESSHHRGTPGKILTGSAVTTLDGRTLGFGHATVHHLARVLSMMSGWLGYLPAAFTRRRQTLHDLIAGCVVIRK